MSNRSHVKFTWWEMKTSVDEKEMLFLLHTTGTKHFWGQKTTKKMEINQRF